MGVLEILALLYYENIFQNQHCVNPVDAGI